jgi:hypothetical protein
MHNNETLWGRAWGAIKRLLRLEPATGVESLPGQRRSLTRSQRLSEYFRRLTEQPASRTAEEALARLSQTLTDVEDELSGVPRQEPPPLPNVPDGRMYPPQADMSVRHADGSITARTRGHDVLIGRDGSITVTNRRTGQVEFHQNGAGD